MAKTKRTPTPTDESTPRSMTRAYPWLPAEIEAIYTRGDSPRLDNDEFAKLGAWVRENRPHRPPPPRSLGEMAEMGRQTVPSLDTPAKVAFAEWDRQARVAQRLRKIYKDNVNLRTPSAPRQAGEIGKPEGSGDADAKEQGKQKGKVKQKRGRRGAKPWRNAKQDKQIYDARKTRKLSYPALAREFFGDVRATRKAAKAIDSHRQKLRRQGRK